MVVADDLAIGEEVGYKVFDVSRSPSDPNHAFFLKVILLFMQGDYPAQGKASGMMHAGGYCCHWCMHVASNNRGVMRMVSGKYDHYLPQNHPKRGASSPREPEPRLHAATCKDALKNQMRRDTRVRLNPRDVEMEDKTKHIRGAKEWCPLAKLHLFDVIWDFVPDMMHLVQGVLKTYIVQTMKGSRAVKVPKPLKTEGFQGDALAKRNKLNRDALHEYKEAVKVLTPSIFT